MAVLFLLSVLVNFKVFVVVSMAVLFLLFKKKKKKKGVRLKTRRAVIACIKEQQAQRRAKLEVEEIKNY